MKCERKKEWRKESERKKPRGKCGNKEVVNYERKKEWNNEKKRERRRYRKETIKKERKCEGKKKGRKCEG